MKGAVADSGKESVIVASRIVKYGDFWLVVRLNGLVGVGLNTNKLIKSDYQPVVATVHP